LGYGPKVELLREDFGQQCDVKSAEVLVVKEHVEQKRFITSIVTQQAIASDDPGLDQTLRDQAATAQGG